MDGRPWLFDNYLFVLKYLKALSQPAALHFDYEVLWIQMFNLPIMGMNLFYGNSIGETISKVVNVDVESDDIGWGCYLLV